MQYFELLPTIDINNQKFRNLFKRVIVQSFEENQLINTFFNEYDTLTSLSRQLYGSTDYWWVIAILNDLHDIVYDLPLTSSQIDKIAQDNSTDYSFENCIKISGTFNLMDAENVDGTLIKTISFKNDSEKEFYVQVTPFINENIEEMLEYMGEYSCFNQSVNSFTFMMYIGMQEPDTNASQEVLDMYDKMKNMTFSYVVLSKPSVESTVDANKFSEIYDILLRDNDKKRNIRLIKPEDLNKFLANFTETLAQEIKNIKGEYTKVVNGLAKYDEVYIPEYGVYVKKGSGMFRPNRNMVELTGIGYSTDDQMHLMSSVNDTEVLGNVGAMGVDYLNASPRVYHSGSSVSPFNYMILSPSHIRYSKNKEILKCGISPFAGNGNELLISIDDETVLSKDEIAFMITPIVDNVETYVNNGNFGFRTVDKRTAYIVNTGNAGGRFFWALYRNNISEYFYTLPVVGKKLNMPTNEDSIFYQSLTPFIAVCLTPDSTFKQTRLPDLGRFGYLLDNQKNSFNIICTGNSSMPFLHKILFGYESSYIETDENGKEIYISSYPSILSPDYVNLYIIPAPRQESDLAYYGNYGLQIIDKNNLKLYSERYGRYKWHLIGEWNQNGYGVFAGSESYYRINLNNFDDIRYPEDVKLMITPIFENGHIKNVGYFDYIIRDKNTVDVFNTGNSNIKFKWCLLKGDSE